MDQSKAIVVFEGADPTEANMARGLLESSGIPVIESGSGGVGALSILAGPLSQGLRTLAVPPELEERALEILEKAWGKPPASE